jgi:hypothetical protein
VAVSGDTIVVGAFAEGGNATGVNGDESSNSSYGSGAAYVFARYGTYWYQEAYLKASNTEQTRCCLPADIFGYSVAISGNTILIGASGEDSGAADVNGDQNDNSISSSGAAYVFVRDANTWAWTQQAYLKPSNPGENDRFGWSVAVEGHTAVVGAYFEDSSANGVNGDENNDGAPYSGAAYVFVREGTNWSQQAYLKASNTEQLDNFGQSVAVSGDLVVVGARGESSGAAGVNGNQNDNSKSSAGAAYVFTRSGATWSQQAYLKASNPDINDIFGFAVAASGDTVVVGAYPEGGNTTGISTNQSSNGAGYSGAAYVFAGLGVGPQFSIVPDRSGGYFVRAKASADITYELQRTTTVNGPWTTIASLTARSSGRIEFHDASAPEGQAFYRVTRR